MIIYENSDLLKSDCNIRCHQVNCRGKMNSGLAKQVRIKYWETYDYYVMLCKKYGSKLLGGVQYTECHDGYYLCNMFAQDGYGRDRLYTNYDALEKCISKVYNRVNVTGESVAFPYLLGCNLGGGNWYVVQGIIEKYFKCNNIICKIHQYIKE